MAGRKMRTLFDALASERGLTLSRARAMLLLSRNARMTQTELAAELDIEHPTVVRLLDGLEKQGLIARRPSEADRRIKHITLTEAAADQVADLDEMIALLRTDLLEGLPEADVEAASRVLRHVIGRIESWGQRR